MRITEKISIDTMNEGEKTNTLREAAKDAVSSPGDQACKDNPDLICPVTSSVSDDLIFIKRPLKDCPYYVPFGYGGFCNFQPRKELYKNYNI